MLRKIFLGTAFVPFVAVPLLVGTACKDPPKAAPSASSAAPTVSVDPKPWTHVSAVTSAEKAPLNNTVTPPEAKDIVVTMKEPEKEHEKTVKGAAGGSLTVYMPDYDQTKWTIEGTPDKALGKVAEQSIPGFLPNKVIGHEFKWTTTAVKAGTKAVIKFANRPTAIKTAKPNHEFTLTVEFGS